MLWTVSDRSTRLGQPGDCLELLNGSQEEPRTSRKEPLTHPHYGRICQCWQENGRAPPIGRRGGAERGESLLKHNHSHSARPTPELGGTLPLQGKP